MVFVSRRIAFYKAFAHTHTWCTTQAWQRGRILYVLAHGLSLHLFIIRNNGYCVIKTHPKYPESIQIKIQIPNIENKNEGQLLLVSLFFIVFILCVFNFKRKYWKPTHFSNFWNGLCDFAAFTPASISPQFLQSLSGPLKRQWLRHKWPEKLEITTKL